MEATIAEELVSDMTALEKDFFDAANEIMGNRFIIHQTDQNKDNSISPTGERYKEIWVPWTDLDACMRIWKNIIRSYKYFASYDAVARTSITFHEKLTLERMGKIEFLPSMHNRRSIDFLNAQ